MAERRRERETPAIFQIFSLHLEVRMISLSPLSLSLSHRLSIPRVLSRFIPLALSSAGPPRHRYNVASFRHPQSPPRGPPLQSHTKQPSEGERERERERERTPLVFIIKISIGSKPRYLLQYAAGNAGDIHTKTSRRGESRAPPPSPAWPFHLSISESESFSLTSAHLRAPASEPGAEAACGRFASKRKATRDD